LRLHREDAPLTDFDASLSSLTPIGTPGGITVSFIESPKFNFKGHMYTLGVDPAAPVAELKRLLSVAIGGSVPPDKLIILEGRSVLDDEMTLEDIEYCPLSEPLITEEEGPQTARLPCHVISECPVPVPVHAPGAFQRNSAPRPPAVTPAYVIGLELGVVPRCGKFQFPPEMTLANILPELRIYWELGDLGVEFRLMNRRGSTRMSR
jgi:hypothetical protein